MHIWNQTLFRLANLQPAPLSTEKLYHGDCFSLFYYKDKLIAVDTWDTLIPTFSFYKNGAFSQKPLSDIRLLIKIQHCPNEFWDEFTKNTGIPVTSWTMFPNSKFNLQTFKWQSTGHKYTSILSGKYARFGRNRWIDVAKQYGNYHLPPSYNHFWTIEEYINILKQCKWGLSLVGKRSGGDGKNRREIEYASCGMPLALNYQPHYPFEFIPNRHYLYLDKPESLKLLETTDPRPFAERSCEIYDKYFSATGMRKLLELIMIKAL